MICANGHQMHEEDVITHNPTAPGEETEYQRMWVCDEDCGEMEPIINQEEEES